MPDHRGSRRQILHWRDSTAFLPELNSLLKPSGVTVADAATVLPLSHTHPAEARLETYGPRHLPGAVDWDYVRHWWLQHPAGANTPNWDLAAIGARGNRPVLVLAEAKANVPELSSTGKPLDRRRSVKSLENDARIRAAIDQADQGWKLLNAHVHLGHAAHYQLSNRLAFTWRLASLGLDIVLVYLGFTGDHGIADAGEPFKDDEHWQRAFWHHARAVVPRDVFERELRFGPGSAWLLLRSLPAQSISPPRRHRLPSLALGAMKTTPASRGVRAR